jgi:cell division septum initiation protein DivIVA
MSTSKNEKQQNEYLKAILEEIRSLKEQIKKLETKLETETKAIRKDLISKKSED